MIDQVLIALASVLGTAITGFVTLRIFKRRHSGTIQTSDAASLWKEGASLRDNLTQQVIGLRAQLTAATDQLAAATVSIAELLNQIAVGNAAVASAREETRLSREETSLLRAAIAEVHQEVKTGNALSLGALADNTESRRIQGIPEAERTQAEQEHVDIVGIQEHHFDRTDRND